MLSLKYKLPTFIQSVLLSLSLVMSFMIVSPLVAQPAYAAVTSKCATEKSACDCSSSSLNTENCGIIYYLWLVIDVLSGLVGVAIVTSIIIAGFQWMTAGDNPQQISSARNRIINALIALFVFIFMFAFLQWVVPGGIL